MQLIARAHARWHRLGFKARYLPLLLSIDRHRDPATGPQELMVDFCHPCNLHCLCCYNYSPLGPSPFTGAEGRSVFPSDLFVRLLDDCVSLGIGHISLAGYGEPLLHPDCAELLQEMRSRRLRALVTTNGTLLTRSPWIGEVLYAAVVSIQAGTPDGYTRMHPTDPSRSWDLVLQGLRLLQESGVPTTIAFVLCSENFQDLEAAIDLAGAHGANLAVQMIKPFIRKEEGRSEFDPEKIDSLQLTPTQLAGIKSRVAELEQRAQDKGIQLYGLRDYVPPTTAGTEGDPGCGGDAAIEAFYRKQPCYVGWYFSRILIDGTVTPCCQCLGGITFGNIHDRPFAEIWKSAEYRRFRTETLNIPLTETEVWSRCQCTICDSVTQNRRIHEQLNGQGATGKVVCLARRLLGRGENR